MEAEARAKSAPEPSKAPAAPPREKPKKLGFKEKRELEELPKKIESLEAQLARSHEEMAAPG
jgi:ABC transport system ATP-binding/permease protein